ncbi:hypothetical protein IGK30_001249 [Enterococcus sp. AZ178]|nr:hypothetical protein A5878_000612 [Enterococcus sp. 3G6_DIV0642]
MDKFNQHYLLVFSVVLLLVMLVFMQYREYPDYFVITVVYLVSSYSLLYKFRNSSIISKAILCFTLLIFGLLFLSFGL